MTAAPNTRPGRDVGRSPDAESAVQLALTLAVGAVAAAASWSHVLDLAGRHGQGGWLAWAVAACIETSAVSAGLDVRRRRRGGLPLAFPICVLVGATALQLAAQVAQAERTGWGVVLAAVPAVTFLTLVKLAVTRMGTPSPTVRLMQADAVTAVVVEPAPAAPPVAVPESDRQVTATVELVEPTGAAQTASAQGGEEARELDVGDLLLVGRAVADDLTREGQPLNRRTLLAGVRDRGRSCSSERAGVLLKALRQDGAELDERAG